MQDTACHRCATSAYFKNEPLLRDLGFYFRTTTLALPPCCPLHQRRADSRRRFNDSGDFEFWERWDDFLNLLFFDTWTCGGHNLESLVVWIGGAPSAGREDWNPNLDHAHWLAHDGCRRYREKVLLLLHDRIRLLGG